MVNDLEEFLESKGAEYAPFNPKRAPKLFQALKLNPTCISIQILGTNGKGSTGRFLALMLRQKGFNVGHFTSPHLLNLTERFWHNGKECSKEVLNQAFLTLNQEILQEASYFEVLTFLAIKLFGDCDYMILEAGLGGEYDSTTTCVKFDLSLFTAISLEHQEFLGETLEEIAQTKLKAMAKKAILGFNPQSVIKIAQNIAKQKHCHLKILKTIPSKIWLYCRKHSYPSYQAENLALAFEGLKTLGYDCDFKSLDALDLQGRMQKIAPNVWVDVAHNLGGAQKIFHQFSQMQLILVYNSFFDKNPKAILGLLKPLVKRVEILNINHKRLIKKEELEQILKSLQIPYCDFKQIQEDEKYLVCGSFSVVAEFLKGFK